MMKNALLGAFLLVLCSGEALAQASWKTPNGSTAAGLVTMCVTNGIATPCPAGVGSGGTSAAYTGASSRSVLTGAVAIVVPAGLRTILTYQLSGALSDTACFVFASATSTPAFVPKNTGSAIDCGIAGSFVLQGQSRYNGPPPAPGFALFGQVVGTSPTDTFAITAEW